MGTIAGANASHAFRDDVFRFCLRDRSASGVHLRKIFPEFVRNLQLPLARDRSGLEGPHADGLAIGDGRPEGGQASGRSTPWRYRRSYG